MTMRPPAAGARMPEMILMRVDLPEPFSPTMQCTSPTSNVRSTLHSACTPPNVFEILKSCRKGAMRLDPESAVQRGAAEASATATRADIRHEAGHPPGRRRSEAL